jgi:exonuclease-1
VQQYFLVLTSLPVHFVVIYKLDRKDGSCDVVTMDWLLNTKFLPPSRRNRRQRDDSDDSDSEEEEINNSREKRIPPQNNSDPIAERHASEIDYDDDDNMMYAPIRRTLPLPLGNVPPSKSNSRARRSTSSKEGTTGAAFLSTLRSFAHKEANDPGAGCRLFIQACVLSGCDYVPNRLSKVGPITAFKMVKDASHRKHAERFDRVMKSLPRGSILQNESSDDKNNDDEGAYDNDNDFSTSCGSPDNDMKEKYLELLTKSEAIFYYHLVREQASDLIVPLVPHKQSSIDNDVSANLSPSIENFHSDLSFIGSIEEALKNNPTAAPPCPSNQPGSTAQKNSGWIVAKRSVGTVKNNYIKAPVNHPKKDMENQGPQKGTLQYAFNRPNNALTSRTSTSQHSSSCDNTTNKQPGVLDQSNPFSSFAHNASSEYKLDQLSSKATPNVSQKAGTIKTQAASPFFSPMGNTSNFDYVEEPSASKDSSSITNKSNGVPGTAKLDKIHIAPNGSFDGFAVESSRLHSSPAQKENDNTFDYEIIVESPPVTSGGGSEPQYSKYFDQMSRTGSPRRVSTSPLYKPNAFNEGSSPDYAIDLSDEPESPNKKLKDPGKSLYSSQTSHLSKSSVNKRPFKSPYPSNQNATSDSVARKKPRQVSSGALLAGFAVQKRASSGIQLGTRQRLAARNANSKKPNAKSQTHSIQSYLKQK